MSNLADDTLDLFVNHDIDLMRVDAGLRNKIDGMMNGLGDRLKKKIIRFDPTSAGPVIQNKKLNQLVYASNPDIEKAFQQITDTVVGDLSDLSVVQGATVSDTLEQVMRVDLASNQVHLAKLKALAGNTMIEGAPVKEWWARQAPNFREAFKDQIRAGMLEGDTIPDMIRRVQGSRANRFQDGIIAKAGKRAHRLVRTSTMAVANAARMDTYKANSHVIKGVQWVSTLDNRTSDICIALDGQAWTLDGKRMKGTTHQWQGPPPAHWNCRSTTIPIVKTLTEMAREKKNKTKIDGLDKANKNKFRAAADGKQASSLNYEGWLKKRPVAEQKAVLGPTKYRLWKQNKISFTDLVDQKQNPVSVAELSRIAAQQKQQRALARKKIDVPVVKKRTGRATTASIDASKVKYSDEVITLSGERIQANEFAQLVATGNLFTTKGLKITKKLKDEAQQVGDTARKSVSAQAALNVKADDVVDALGVKGLPKTKAIDSLRDIAASADDDVYEIAGKITPAMEKFRTTLINTKLKAARMAEFDEWIKDVSIPASFKKKTVTARVNNKVTKITLHDKVVDSLREVYLMTGQRPRTFQHLQGRSARGYASRESSMIDVGVDANKATIWHEYGHHIEYSKDKYRVSSHQFLMKRRFSEDSYQLKKQLPGSDYGKDEMGYLGDFVDPYVGKNYMIDASGKRIMNVTTEVLSMGLEHFTTARRMSELYITDREFFNMMVGIIKDAG